MLGLQKHYACLSCGSEEVAALKFGGGEVGVEAGGGVERGREGPELGAPVTYGNGSLHILFI